MWNEARSGKPNMISNSSNSALRARFDPRARRRGISTYLFLGALPVIIGMTGLVVDLSTLYTRRAVAQRAADAAALAGALISAPDLTQASGSNDGEIIAEAQRYANNNGYTDPNAITVDPHVGGQGGKVQVTLARNEQVYFVPILEKLSGGNPAFSRTVRATAIAEKVVTSSLSLGGNYGTTTGASNPSAFGPWSFHSFGDPYSVLYHDDGTPNTLENINKNKGDATAYNKTSRYNPDGFTYTMSVSQQFVAQNANVRVQLYDPDGYDSRDGQSLDELHGPNWNAPGANPGGKIEATTRYTVYKVMPDKSLREIKSVEYGADQATDAAYLKSLGQDPWITPEGFVIPTSMGAGEYKIRVQTLDGSSENGYNLRAGPDYEGIKSETDWNNEFGDQGGLSPGAVKVPITADDKLQMNFTRTDHVRVRLGYLPKSVAGKNFTVTKFDTDVGSTSIKYSYVEDQTGVSKSPSDDTNRLVPNNDFWSKDEVEVPADFQGGYWYAEYDAGQNDTSSWGISYAGLGSGTVRLVQ